MTRLAHITDLHFGAEDPAVVAALAAELNADPPDLVAVSGDLTQGARLREFRAARAFLDSLSAPWLAVPGNHDISPYNLLERFTDPYLRWRRIIAQETAPRWRNGQVAVFGLNSARRLGLNWDWSRGRVTHRRLQALIADLDAVPAALVRIVVVHHPLLGPEGDISVPVVGGAERALRLMAAHGVSLILAGHLHRGYVRATQLGLHHPMIVQGATATSVRLRGEPNAYNRISLDADGQAAITVRVWNGGGWEDKPGIMAQPPQPAEATV
jgi:3',5'-cyclic AMP phosphodiesterase CpdA